MTRFLKTMTFTAMALTLAWASAMLAQRSADAALRAAIETEMTRGASAAIQQYQRVADTYRRSDPAVAAQALLRMAQSYEKLGDARKAAGVYEEIVRAFIGETQPVSIAEDRLSEIAIAQVQLTRESEPGDRVSRDGRYVSFIMRDSSNLGVRELATNRIRALTSEGNPREQYPSGGAVFSPDSRQIAYSWCFEQNYRCVLRIGATAENSTAPRKTVYQNDDVEHVSPLDWSPNGEWISLEIHRKDRTRQIGLFNVARGELRVLRTLDWSGAGGLRFSADSSMVAYDRSGGDSSSSRDVFVITVDGARDVAVAATPGDDSVLEWTPDGERLLIASDRGGSKAIWAIAFRDGTPASSFQLVKPDVGNIRSAGLTRTGALYYLQTSGGSEINVAPLDLVSGQFLSTPIQPIQQFTGLNISPVWSSDGEYLAYRDARRPVMGIVTMKTGSVRELKPALSYMGDARWSPDKKWFIARATDLKGRSGIMRIDATTGEASYLAPACDFAQWPRNNSASFFCTTGTLAAARDIVQIDAASGAVVRTFPGAGSLLGVSPDDRFLLHLNQDSVLLLSLADGKSRNLLQLVPPESRFGNMFSFDFTPDGRSIAFFGGIRGNNGMWLLPLDGGAPRRIDAALETVRTWRFNPRTNQVAFSSDSGRTELWKMENFLPPSASR